MDAKRLADLIDNNAVSVITARGDAWLSNEQRKLIVSALAAYADRSRYVPSQPKQIIDPPGAGVEMFRRRYGRLPNKPGDQLPLADRLELAAQACRAAHLLSCEATCREAAARLCEPSAGK